MQFFQHKLNKIAAGFTSIGVLGFADAAYLTAKYYAKTPIPCSLLAGCETVTTSIYATIGTVPIALLGALYYLLLVVLAIAYFDTKQACLLEYAAYLSTVGFLVSLILVYLQLFVLHAICLYCMTSAATSTLLFILGMLYLRMSHKTSTIKPETQP